MNQQDTTNSADVESFKDDPIEVVRCVAGLAAQYAAMDDADRLAQIYPLGEWSPLAKAAQRICLLNGYAEDGNELPGFMERAALRELEANPTKELRDLQEAMTPAEPARLSPEQIADLAVRAGVKGSAAALAEFAALVREAQPLAPEEMRPAPIPAPEDEPNPFARPTKWTLLLTGDNHGLVGEFGSKWEGRPEHYERVNVVEVVAPVAAHAAPTDKRLAPWPDFAGNPIHAGDLIEHPSGERGRVVYVEHVGLWP